MSKNPQSASFWDVRVPTSDHEKFCHAAKQAPVGLHNFVADAVTEYLEAGSPRLPYSDAKEAKFYGAFYLPLNLAIRIGWERGKRNPILESAIRFKAQSLPEVVHAVEPPHTPKIDVVALAARMIGFHRRTANQGNQPTA